jgi:hypothetical protein
MNMSIYIYTCLLVFMKDSCTSSSLLNIWQGFLLFLSLHLLPICKLHFSPLRCSLRFGEYTKGKTTNLSAMRDQRLCAQLPDSDIAHTKTNDWAYIYVYTYIIYIPLYTHCAVDQHKNTSGGELKDSNPRMYHAPCDNTRQDACQLLNLFLHQKEPNQNW